MSPRRITIPTIGSELRLTADWHFPLFHEQRNKEFCWRLGLTCDGPSYGPNVESTDIALPEGTRLVVDRVYVRRGADAFDSVTFRIRKGDFPGDKGIFGRFWAKLADVNMIECEWDEYTVKRGETV